MVLNIAEVLDGEAYGARLLRIERELRQVPFEPHKCKVLYAVGKTGCTGLEPEECVVAYENQAIWTSGKAVRKRFTVQSDILQICWVNFTSQTGSHAALAGPSKQAASASAAADAAPPKQSPAAALAASWQARDRSVSPLGLNSSSSPLFANTTAAPGTATATTAAGDTPAAITGVITPAARLAAAADAAKLASAATAAAEGGARGVGNAVLCLLHKTSITCVYPSGEVLETPLLQPCHAIWPLPSGLLLAGPADSSASVLTHPLEEPLPVVADCSISSSGGRGSVAAFAGWSQERVVWSSGELPYVSTYNESRGRLNIWQIRPMPPEAAGIGSSFELPVVSPLGLLQPRTPAATAAAFGSPGGGYTGFGSASGFSGAAGYSPAAYSGSLLGPLAQGPTPKTGASSYANWSMGGTSAAKRSSLRTPQGCLPASIFNPTPAQTPWAGGLGALGVLRPCFSNTTQAQQAMLLPGPDPPVMFKLMYQEELVGGSVPHEACVATDADGCPLLCVLCKGGAQQLLGFRLPDASFPKQSVKLAFSLPALAAAPVATHFSLPSSTQTCHEVWQLLDLLVLQPSGTLVLHRGSYALAAVTIQLPKGIATQLAEASAAGQQQQREVRRPSLGAAAAGASLLAGPMRGPVSTAGSLGCLSMSEASDGEGAESDDMMMSPSIIIAAGTKQPFLTPPTADNRKQQHAVPAADSQVQVTDLSSPAGSRFTMHAASAGSDLAAAPTAVEKSAMGLRVRLSLSWLPGLPSQVLQALHEALPEQVYQQLLGLCLQQQGACCGQLSTEWRVIATVVLAWAISPNAVHKQLVSGSQQPSLMARDQDGSQAAAAAGTTVAGAGAAMMQSPARAPAAAATADGLAAAAATPGEGGSTVDMDMATPEAATAKRLSTSRSTLQPLQQQQQQQQVTPRSAMSDMSMAMSIDSASMATGPRTRGILGTPMSISTTRLASRLQTATNSAALQGASSSADAYFPTAAVAVDVQSSGQLAGVLAGQQQQQHGLRPPQQQQDDQQQLHPAADAAWQQLLASQQSQQLLKAFPLLQAPAQQQQQQQQQQGQPSSSGVQPATTQEAQPQLASLASQQHKQQVLSVLHSIHSVYEDCKLARLRLYQLQLLGPLCWTLAGLLGAASYQEHYERNGSPSSLAAAAEELCTAAAALVGQPAPVVQCLASAAAATIRRSVLQRQQQQQQGGSQGDVSASGFSPPEGLLEPPGDIMCCLRHLLSATGKHQRYIPWLAQKGSPATQRTCQLLQAYQVLDSCSKHCAEAVAAAAAAGAATAEQPATTFTSQAFGSPLLESLFSPTASVDTAAGTAGSFTDSSRGLGQLKSLKGDALAAELEHILLLHSRKLVLLLVQMGWDVMTLDSLPIGVALPLKEAVSRCRTNPPSGWPVMAYALIGREDVAATLASNSSSAATAQPADSSPSSSSNSEQVASAMEPGAATSKHPAADTSIQQPLAAAAPTSQQQQHLLLPYEQRLLLPAGSHGADCSQSKSAATGADTNSNSKLPATHGRRAGRLLGRGLRAAGTTAAAASERAKPLVNPGPATEFAAPIDGMDGLIDGLSTLRFGRDNRLLEVRALLSTHVPVALAISSLDSDPDLQAKQQAALLSSAMRTMAMPLGRGALTLGLSQPLPGEHIAVPLLCLSGVVAGPRGETGAAGGRILVSLDLQAAQAAPGAAADVTAWCEFHNGVAAGLKVTPRKRAGQLSQEHKQGLQDNSSGSGTLADAWLPHSKRTVPNYGHAGVLLGLGLQGHLDRLSWTDLYRYLSDQHDATTIGVLLGMSACCRGSADTTVARMLFLHLPARHPNTFPEIELSPHVQAASLLGLGLLYQGSCHRLMTETMLEEIGRTPGVNPSLANMATLGGPGVTGASLSALMTVTHDREAYALSAGFGLGLICLGQGRNAAGLADLHLEEKLRSFMDSNTQPHTASHRPLGSELNSTNGKANYSNRPHSMLDSVLGPGVVNWDPVFGEYPAGHTAAYSGAGATVKLDSEQQQQYGISQVVLEGPGVNTYVSGPAAAIALMMMYLKTGDAGIAAKFKVPNTAYALDHTRPDMILLMVLGGALVMWDSIAATQDWISGQLPPLLNYPLPTILDNMLSAAAAAGAAGARAAGQNLDWGAVGLAHVHALSGACFAIGLRFAGTCNSAAEALLRQHLLQLLHAKRRAPGGPNDQSVGPAMAAAAAAAAATDTGPDGVGIGFSASAFSVGKLDKQTVENSICVVLLSLSLVMAGSGHLPTFRLVQALSRRSAGPLRTTQAEGQAAGGIAALLSGPGSGTGNLNYGNHLAVSLAAGLLFLSGGRSSISTSNESIAALLIALYPVWPNSPTDHRCHLQAFRHLYVLAAEPRCLQAVDVHSRRQVVVPLEVTADKGSLCGPMAVDLVPSAAEGSAAGTLREQQQQQQQQGVQGLMLGINQQLQPSRAASLGEQQNGADGMVWSPRAAAGCAQSGQQQLPPAAAATGLQGAQAPGTAVVIKRHAPCLLPERSQLKSLRVCGPRYWPVQVAAAAAAVPQGHAGSGLATQTGLAAAAAQAASSSNWSQLFLQQRICVKKKAGSLAYIDDPSGVKSLLFRAFYVGSRTVGRSSSHAPAIQAPTEEEYEDAAEQQQQEDEQAPQQAFDIVHLCDTFSADPQIHAFAQLLRAATVAAAATPHIAPGSQALQHSKGAGTAAAAATTASFLSFCHGALFECIIEEKTAVLPWYLQLHSLVHKVCAAAAAAAGNGCCFQQPLGGLSSCSGVPSQSLSTAIPPAVQLQDLQLVLSYYSSSIAAAAAACRKAAVDSSGSSRIGSLQQQQLEGWQVEALYWLPLLQPGLCDSLWKVLQQHWRQARLLPANAPTGQTAGDSCLQQYLVKGSIRDATAPVGGAPGNGVAEQLLGSCLSMLGLPPAADVWRAIAQLPRQAGATEQQGPQQWVPALAQQLPDATGTALLALATAAQAAAAAH